MGPMTSRASSNGLGELSGEQGWAPCLALYVHNVMMNRWDTNAAASPDDSPTLHVNRISRGLAAQLREDPWLRAAARHIPPS